jgi:hypothetical protein
MWPGTSRAGSRRRCRRRRAAVRKDITAPLIRSLAGGTGCPGWRPAGCGRRICDDLLEASIPGQYKQASSALAVDWSDVETFSRPPAHGTSDCADPEASWGHRPGGGPGQDSELFFGYYASAGTMMREEHGPAVPELARRMTVSSCHTDPARALVPVLTRMPRDGIPLGDILDDSGYAHRDAEAWAIPLRQAGARLVQDLHPSDRGPKGTHEGAIIANGNLYCPMTPPQVAAKTRQKHDYPSAAHRRSCTRRTGAERTFSTAKDPASNNRNSPRGNAVCGRLVPGGTGTSEQTRSKHGTRQV